MRAEDDPIISGAGTSGIALQSLTEAIATKRKPRAKETEALEGALRTALNDEAEEFLLDIDAQMTEINPSGAIGGEVSAFDTASRVYGLAALLFGRTSQPYQRRLPALLKALRGLQSLDTFAYDREAAKEYLNAAHDLVDRGGFRFVVFGHTHLAKHVPLGNGRFYFNCGTWADILRFPIEILQTRINALPALDAFVAKMKAGNFSDWTYFRPTCVRLDVGSDDKVANAKLMEFENL